MLISIIDRVAITKSPHAALLFEIMSSVCSMNGREPSFKSRTVLKETFLVDKETLQKTRRKSLKRKKYNVKLINVIKSVLFYSSS